MEERQPDSSPINPVPALRPNRGALGSSQPFPSRSPQAAPETAEQILEAAATLRAFSGRRNDEILLLIEAQASRLAIRDVEVDSSEVSRLLSLMPTADAETTEIAVALLRLVSTRSRSTWLAALDLESSSPGSDSKKRRKRMSVHVVQQVPSFHPSPPEVARQDPPLTRQRSSSLLSTSPPPTRVTGVPSPLSAPESSGDPPGRQSPMKIPSLAVAETATATIICRVCETAVPRANIKIHMATCEKRNRQDMIVVRANEKLAEFSRQLAGFGREGCLAGVLVASSRAQETEDFFQLLKLDFDVKSMPKPCPFIQRKSRQLRGLIQEKKLALKERDYDPLVLFKREEPPPLLLHSSPRAPRSPILSAASTLLSPRRSPVPFSPRNAKVTLSPSDFQIIKPLTKGGFGHVYLVRRKQTGDVFAMKVASKAALSQKNALRKMKMERDILARTENPFVVKLFYSFTSNENVFCVMEYLPGGDLFSLLQNLGTLGEDMARFYTAETVLALEYLHGHGIVHQDIKPDNILISSTGHIKLVDFGLSHRGLIAKTNLQFHGTEPQACLEAMSPHGASQCPLIGTCEFGETPPGSAEGPKAEGTPDYLGPEVLLGLPVGPPADFWSLGCLLFEFLVGVPPFSADTPNAIFDRILRRDAKWPTSLSPEARDLIDRLLTINSETRLGSHGVEEVKRHPFFSRISWDSILSDAAPFVPTLESKTDSSFFNARQGIFKIEERAADDLARESSGGSPVSDLWVNFGHLAAETQRVYESESDGDSSGTPDSRELSPASSPPPSTMT